MIDLTLNIRWIISKVHECHISLLVIAMKYDDELITIDYFDELLMKIIRFIHNVDVEIIIDQIDDVDL